MHISEGILPAQLCISGYGITSFITWYSLRQINRLPNPQASIPKASLLTAAFFVASSIHIPIPPASVHLVLNGLLGTVLGYYAFPAILVGLFFQAIMFGHGGLTTLGINALIMGIPALLAYQIFQLRHILGNGIKE
ncbi:MAG: cobalt transporter CbiM, partial [Okeania sp. SIO2D1]|nr:cobalt transporter CbiM [Okeania sp. SIO2D1]